MTDILERKEKSGDAKLRQEFNSVLELLLTLSKDPDGKRRPFDPVDMATTAGALVGVGYIARNSSVLLGHPLDPKSYPLMDEVNSLFEFAAGACLREIERQKGVKFDKGSQVTWDVIDGLCHTQEGKFSRYMAALIVWFTKQQQTHRSIGTDLAIAVQKDVYGEEIMDVLFAMSLINLVIGSSSSAVVPPATPRVEMQDIAAALATGRQQLQEARRAKSGCASMIAIVAVAGFAGAAVWWCLR
jgi:hypothetical protein